MDRTLDVINENDEIIDHKTRREVHALGLLHREIHVFMFDENMNVFFQKKGLHKPSAGLLDATVAGHVDRGEEYMAAAVRETSEETGITIAPSDLVHLKKLKVSDTPKNDSGRPINNFIREIYIYKKPILEKALQKEAGIQGGGFQKLSYVILLKPGKDIIKLFSKHVLSEEIPHVLDYIAKLN